MTGLCIGVTSSSFYVSVAILVAAALYRWSHSSTYWPPWPSWRAWSLRRFSGSWTLNCLTRR